MVYELELRNINISGCSNDKESADGFAFYFKSVFYSSNYPVVLSPVSVILLYSMV